MIAVEWVCSKYIYARDWFKCSSSHWNDIPGAENLIPGAESKRKINYMTDILKTRLRKVTNAQSCISCVDPEGGQGV